MKRSGGHAVIRWLLESMPGSAFFNNEIPVQPILVGQRGVPDGSLPYGDWLKAKEQMAGLSRPIAGAPALLISLEDHELGVRPFHHPDAKTIVIVRHPENLFASRIRKAANSRLKAYDYTDPEVLRRTVQIWKEHARVALGLTIPSAASKAILYDAWLMAERYRAKLADDFELVAPAAPSSEPTKEGGGSSFAEMTIQPKQLLRRAHYLNEAEKAVLDTIMADREVAELGDHIASLSSAL